MKNQTSIDNLTGDAESASVQPNHGPLTVVRRPEPKAALPEETFDQRLHRVYLGRRVGSGPRKPISRRRLADLLWCSTKHIREIEDRAILKLKPVLIAYADTPFRQSVLNR